MLLTEHHGVGEEPVWRIYIDDSGRFVPCCVQYFDMRDYDNERWLVNHNFDTKAEAQVVIDRIYATMFHVLADRKSAHAAD